MAISANTPTQLSLSWDRPPAIDINGVLTFYSLRYHRVGYNDYNFTVVNGSLESVILKGLDNYTLYEVFIAATTANGTGPFISQAARTSENGNFYGLYNCSNSLRFLLLFFNTHSSTITAAECKCCQYDTLFN